MLIRFFVACAHRSFVRSQRSFVLLIKSFQKSITTHMLRPKPPHFPHYSKCSMGPCLTVRGASDRPNKSKGGVLGCFGHLLKLRNTSGLISESHFHTQAW